MRNPINRSFYVEFKEQPNHAWTRDVHFDRASDAKQYAKELKRQGLLTRVVELDQYGHKKRALRSNPDIDIKQNAFGHNVETIQLEHKDIVSLFLNVTSSGTINGILTLKKGRTEIDCFLGNISHLDFNSKSVSANSFMRLLRNFFNLKI